MVQHNGLGDILCAHPCFHGIRDDYRERLAGCAAKEVFGRRQFIYRGGERCSKFYVVHHGRVALEVDALGSSPVQIETLGSGSLLGWSWLAPYEDARFDARALEVTVLISLNAENLKRKMEEDLAFGRELYKRLVVSASLVTSARHQSDCSPRSTYAGLEIDDSGKVLMAAGYAQHQAFQHGMA
jgi:CRP/FNR family transcriptional regulator, cyclic AMP receptor protein